MKILMLNGSSNLKGCTYTALEEVGKTLNTYGIDYEIFQIGAAPIRDCIGCGKCKETGKCIFNDDKADKQSALYQVTVPVPGETSKSLIYKILFTKDLSSYAARKHYTRKYYRYE